MLALTNQSLEEQNSLLEDLTPSFSPTPKLQQIVQLMSAQTNPQLKLQIVDANKNHFKINKHPVRITSESILTEKNEYPLTEDFVLFLTNNKMQGKNMDSGSKNQIQSFLRDINYSLLKGDKRSPRYKFIKSLHDQASLEWASPAQTLSDSESEDQLNRTQYEDVQGEGTQHTYVFLSSDPDFLLDRLEILIAESAAGNNNVLDEILAIGEELHRQQEVSDEEYQNFLTNFGEV